MILKDVTGGPGESEPIIRVPSMVWYGITLVQAKLSQCRESMVLVGKVGMGLRCAKFMSRGKESGR